MKVAVRVDASRRIGSGHLVRSLTMADALRDRGAEVRFVCRDQGDDVYRRVEAEGFPLLMLPAPKRRERIADADYRAWLGVDPSLDAAETLAALGDGCDLVVVDHYGLEREWEATVRTGTGQILAIDDLANRPHDADLLLDQNLRVDGPFAYADLVAADARVLSGPAYAVLRPSYRAARAERERHQQPGRLVAFFGGGDHRALLRTAVAALAPVEAVTDLVVADPDGLRAELARSGVDASNIRPHGPQPDLVDLLVRAEAAVGAGGTTALERLCLGVPSLVTTVAANQRPGVTALADIGALADLGPADRLDAVRLRDAVQDLLADASRMRYMAELGRALVDGYGTVRVVEALLPTSVDALCLRPVTQADRDQLWRWANDRTVRRQALDPTPIGWRQHVAWFAGRLSSPDCRIYLLEADGLPVGQIRFDLADGVARVDYSLDAAVRGRGWGRLLVQRGLDALRREAGDRVRSVEAEVLVGNDASARVFQTLGFAPELPSDGAVKTRYVRDLQETT